MKILFQDDYGVYVSMLCSSIVATPDPDSDGWVVLATEIFGQNVIVRTGLTEADAKKIVRKLFDFGVYLDT